MSKLVSLQNQSTRRTTRKEDLEIPISKKGKKVVRISILFNLFLNYSI